MVKLRLVVEVAVERDDGGPVSVSAAREDARFAVESALREAQGNGFSHTDDSLSVIVESVK